jgi:glycerol-3-phosphate dehydrogenase subunit C
MAGTLGFKKEKFDLSQKVGEPLIESIRQSGLDLLLSDCASCRMKIGKEANVKTLHPIVILRESLIS